MTLLLPALAVTFAAFCIWLTVRVVNRRERWAKWTLATLVGLPVLYVASFGPAYWACSDYRGHIPANREIFLRPYVPLIYVFQQDPNPAQRALARYLEFWGHP